MLRKGSQKIDIEKRKGHVPFITVEADASFSAYGLSHGNRTAIFRTTSNDPRLLRQRISDDIDGIEIVTAKSTFWQFEITYRSDGKEYPDPTPLELPIDSTRPLSLREEMRRFIREEFSRHATDDGYESFEESNDFDLDDESDLMFSQYELAEMQPEYVNEDDQEQKGTSDEPPPAEGEAKPSPNLDDTEPSLTATGSDGS